MNKEPQVIITMDEWKELKAKKTVTEMFEQKFIESNTIDEFMDKIKEMKWVLNIADHEISIWVCAKNKSSNKKQ